MEYKKPVLNQLDVKDVLRGSCGSGYCNGGFCATTNCNSSYQF